MEQNEQIADEISIPGGWLDLDLKHISNHSDDWKAAKNVLNIHHPLANDFHVHQSTICFDTQWYTTKFKVTPHKDRTL